MYLTSLFFFFPILKSAILDLTSYCYLVCFLQFHFVSESRRIDIRLVVECNKAKYDRIYENWFTFVRLFRIRMRTNNDTKYSDFFGRQLPVWWGW